MMVGKYTVYPEHMSNFLLTIIGPYSFLLSIYGIPIMVGKTFRVP